MKGKVHPAVLDGLLTQNEDLKQSGTYGWTLPAHVVKLPEGKTFNTCPSAGVCAAACYAKAGRWMFPSVKEAHLRKLDFVLTMPEVWKATMIRELARKKYHRKFIRIHDGGDFFAEWYAEAWLDIARTIEHCVFYTYTKEVALFQDLRRRKRIPYNFRVIFSLGGKQDHLIDRHTERHAEVFPDHEARIRAGYVDIGPDDRMAAMSDNHRIGLVSNNIPSAKKRQAGRSFSEWQSQKGPK